MEKIILILILILILFIFFKINKSKFGKSKFGNEITPLQNAINSTTDLIITQQNLLGK